MDVDDELIERAMRLTGTRTKKSTVEQALELLIQRHEQRSALRLRGAVEWDGDLTATRRSRDFGA